MWCTALLPVHQDSIARDPGTGTARSNPVHRKSAGPDRCGYFPEGGSPTTPPSGDPLCQPRHTPERHFPWNRRRANHGNTIPGKQNPRFHGQLGRGGCRTTPHPHGRGGPCSLKIKWRGGGPGPPSTIGRSRGLGAGPCGGDGGLPLIFWWGVRGLPQKNPEGVRGLPENFWCRKTVTCCGFRRKMPPGAGGSGTF